jgi:hypothetical protein
MGLPAPPGPSAARSSAPRTSQDASGLAAGGLLPLAAYTRLSRQVARAQGLPFCDLHGVGHADADCSRHKRSARQPDPADQPEGRVAAVGTGGGRPPNTATGSGPLPCTGCGSSYHTAERCYALHPELAPRGYQGPREGKARALWLRNCEAKGIQVPVAETSRVASVQASYHAVPPPLSFPVMPWEEEEGGRIAAVFREELPLSFSPAPRAGRPARAFPQWEGAPPPAGGLPQGMEQGQPTPTVRRS